MIEEEAEDQFTYPVKLQELFDDNEDEEYPLPFNEPDELMNIFADLEERNLSLIKQGQDHDELYEERKQLFD